ncbi:MAG: diaminopimelate epimerase, partial [Actinomycetota bacterium]|nr:diaminopimelate epimerase [Actinomycetota bacterium]
MTGSFPWLKGHGTENDFVVLPDPDGSVHGDLDPALVAALCHRRHGIGADGVLRVVRTEHVDPAPAGEATWFMDHRNADGSTAEMCGNGVRVFARYLAEAGLADPAWPLPVATRGGVKLATFLDGGDVSVEMGPPELQGWTTVTVAERCWPARRVSMGNPHAVVTVADLAEAGPLLQSPGYDPDEFPAGVNVEFVRLVGAGQLAMRVYERGSGET